MSVNIDKREVLDSVGKPLQSFEAKVEAQTGELLLKCPSVIRGYFNNQELTSSVINEDGRLHTGNIAQIDKEGTEDILSIIVPKEKQEINYTVGILYYCCYKENKAVIS